MAKAEFRPWETEHHEMIGSILSINAIQATRAVRVLENRT
jgi:hypothetical protein